MDDLAARFLPQFLKLARSRLEQVREAAEDRGPAALATAAGGLHTLAGEAGLLGFHEVVPLARDCELKIKSLQAGQVDGEVEQLLAALGQLERVIEHIGATRVSR